MFIHAEGFSNGVSTRQRGFQNHGYPSAGKLDTLLLVGVKVHRNCLCVCVVHTTDLRTLCQKDP